MAIVILYFAIRLWCVLYCDWVGVLGRELCSSAIEVVGAGEWGSWSGCPLNVEGAGGGSGGCVALPWIVVGAVVL